MTTPITLILTTQRADLQAAVRDALPDTEIVLARSELPPLRPDGRIWCFVDWLLPEISGLEMCRRLRDMPAMARGHITMVLEEDDSDARRRALRAGADDYIIGPLTAEVLLSRLREYLGVRRAAMTEPRLEVGNLIVDVVAQQARWRGRPVPLPPNEFRLLAHFVEHPDQVFTRSSLIAMLGKDAHAIDERTVDVWIGRLRRALKAHAVPDPLRTVRSMGYVLDRFEADTFRIAS